MARGDGGRINRGGARGRGTKLSWLLPGNLAAIIDDMIAYINIF